MNQDNNQGRSANSLLTVTKTAETWVQTAYMKISCPFCQARHGHIFWPESMHWSNQAHLANRSKYRPISGWVQAGPWIPLNGNSPT